MNGHQAYLTARRWLLVSQLLATLLGLASIIIAARCAAALIWAATGN